jgi:hypothetical protein
MNPCTNKKKWGRCTSHSRHMFRRLVIYCTHIHVLLYHQQDLPLAFHPRWHMYSVYCNLIWQSGVNISFVYRPFYSLEKIAHYLLNRSRPGICRKANINVPALKYTLLLCLLGKTQTLRRIIKAYNILKKWRT